MVFKRFGVIFTAGTPSLAILASQWHGEVLPLATVEPESRACGTNVTHSMPRGVNFGRCRREGDRQNRP